jgi:nucleotide-binding universal stress UspA family protein
MAAYLRKYTSSLLKRLQPFLRKLLNKSFLYIGTLGVNYGEKYMTSDFCRSIVIATDGSENTQKAISYGIKLAKLSGATVHALHVVDISSVSQSWTAGKETIHEVLTKDGQKAISKVKECGETLGVDVKEVLLEGHPSKEIIDFAENNDIDLIVMGTLGKTGLDRFLMGSVAGTVVRNSKVPVLVVRGEEQS